MIPCVCTICNHISDNLFSKYLAFERHLCITVVEYEDILSQLLPFDFLLTTSTIERNNVDLKVTKSAFWSHFSTFPIFMLQFLSYDKAVWTGKSEAYKMR